MKTRFLEPNPASLFCHTPQIWDSVNVMSGAIIGEASDVRRIHYTAHIISWVSGKVEDWGQIDPIGRD